MFLMNPSPLVALQRQWEPFAPARSCRYPICFSESEDDIARTTVSAKVQMIINNLQSDESSLGTRDGYGCLMQKKRKGTKGRGHKLKGSGRGLPGRIQYAQRNCPADSDGMEVEESSEFGPLSLNSDSDDSVDRDIEEAIQEYLRNKGQGPQPLPSSTKSPHSLGGGQRVQQERLPRDAACNMFPAHVKADVVQQHLAPDYLADPTLQWAPSPCSVSSDDSFEQSIKAEIEQFLNEKKQQARNKASAAGSKRLDQKEAHEKLAIKSQKEGANRGNRSFLKQRGQHPEFQNGSTSPQCLKSKAGEELADFQKASQAHLEADHPCILEPSKEGAIGQKLWKASGEQRLEIIDVSDSSSDDGIEEAIRLYQLEKIRKEAGSKTSCVPFPKEEFGASGVADISASLTIHSVKSALPETPRKAPGSRRRQSSSKAAELNRAGAVWHEPGKGGSGISPASSLAKCAVTFQASCRADTAAELMCAEAILDISKTIIPPTVGSDSGSLVTGPFFCSQGVPSSQPESDSNAVDSDDSIEQEIRAFLAVKAQTECLMAKSKDHLPAAPYLPPIGQPDDRARSPKPPIPPTVQLSLSRKRKLKRENTASRQGQGKQLKLSEMGYSHSKIFAAPKEDGVHIPKSHETVEAVWSQQDALAPVSSVEFANSLSQGLLGAEGLVKHAARGPQKYGAGDKSSSLDSDEDLDTAIKDLLRSKRKLKKKPKDQRIPCKKKVRFGDTEMHIFEDQPYGLQGRACRSQTPRLLKSCLTRSRRDVGEETSAKSRAQGGVGGKPTSARSIPGALELNQECPPKLTSGPDGQEVSWTAASLTDDSSSVDSDDSIEQEIQRYLAEKARDSARCVERAGPDKRVEVELGAVRPESVPLKAKRQPLAGRGTAFLKQSKKTTKVGPSGNPPRAGGPTVPSAEGPCSRAAVQLQQAGQGVVQAKGASLPVERTAAEHQGVCDRQPGKDKAEKHKLPSCSKPMASFKRESSYEFKISSKFIAGLKSVQNKKRSVVVGKRQSLELSVLQKRGSLLAASLLGERCEAILQRGVLGPRRREAGVGGVGLSPRGTAEGLHCAASGRPEPAEAPSFHQEGVSLAKGTPPARDLEPCDASRGPPVPESGAGGARVGPGLLHAEAAVEEENGSQPQGHGCCCCWEGHPAPSKPGHSPLKETAWTLPVRIAESPTQRALEAGPAALMDVPGAEHARRGVENKASRFFSSTTIDPGWTVLPYITLSPAQLCGNPALNMLSRRKALQVLGEKPRVGGNARRTGSTRQ
ncbi:protein phosphatase 1 regulatory subunit 26 [Hemicordylus capensis]|uniref:protein phosphatase 1 regulatory subunit 26 n=1 Tax=Hemicordylus capensis TaxID=884348 RepID=UPI0023033E49|nr:protein phosphatase 1 regulatory subunit 26 [Hemicordylus capensis]XP_053138040.1 protein phosphatase 1 regulatory subunit 26 [Hemicordylus capensis]XP_053138041.1 protein phosphatase 1 regulatory subunit 26 [Hemicordylus capensis]XP_053138042.1 protein phosphatase 1 regulatory subunit 26 [Hemicordylus capensis]